MYNDFKSKDMEKIIDEKIDIKKDRELIEKVTR